MGSDYKPFVPSTEPNPLRPYYRPPSIGGSNGSSSYIDHSGPSIGTTTSGASAAPPPSFGTSARDILSDLNYNEILDGSGSAGISIKGLLDQAVWKYTSVFLAQPFEVAKMVLQCHIHRVQAGELRRTGWKDPNSSRRESRHQDYYEDDDDEDDDDEPSYFTSNAPNTPTPIQRKGSSRHRSSISPATPLSPRTPSKSSAGGGPTYKLDLKKADSLMEVISQLWSREGAWGIWKGTNVSFVYSILMRAIESWTRSMLAALLNLPDPGMIPGTSGGVGGLDILDSPSPLASLGITVVATGLAGLILAPLDIARTRIMLTATAYPPRSIIPTLRSLPSWTCPPSLLGPTLLNSTIPTLISTCTPLILRSNFAIDPIITPSYYSICTFVASASELFIKLPFETVLRRGQIEVFRQRLPSKQPQRKSRRSSSKQDEDAEELPTVVEVGPYSGILNTAWRIAREEGDSIDKPLVSARGVQGTNGQQPTTRKGQGVNGLTRGWRVGWWGLVGVWGAAALGSGGKGGEF